MFKLNAFSGAVTEVSFYESRDLETRELRRGPNNNRPFLLFGLLDVARLNSAFRLLVLRHEALRTRFLKTPTGSYLRKIESTADAEVIYVDCTHANFGEEGLKDYLKQIAAEGFGAEDYPLFKIYLLKISPNSSLVLFSVAELIADGGSVSILMNELSELYLAKIESGGKVPLPPLDYQLSDVVASHNAWRKTEAYQHNLSRLCDKIHSQIELGGGIEQLFFLPKSDDSFFLDEALASDFGDEVFRLASVLKISAPTILMMATASSIARARNMEGMFFTSTVSNRHYKGVANLVGHLATTIPNYLNIGAEGKMSAHTRKLHRDLFSSMSQSGMIPIQDVGREIARRYPMLPKGQSIKFGKVVIDALLKQTVELFGMKVQMCPSWLSRPAVNEFKFVYRLLPDGSLRIYVLGLREGDNEKIAKNVIAFSLRDALGSLAS